MSGRVGALAAACITAALAGCDEQRKKAEPFLRDVDRAIGMAERVRAKARDPEALEQVGYDARGTGLDIEEHARAAGLERCGRGASSDVVDAFLKPGFAVSVAESLVAYLGALHEADQVGRRSGGREQQYAYWMQVLKAGEPAIALASPESLKDRETDYTEPLSLAEYRIYDILDHLKRGRPLSARDYREKVDAMSKRIAATRKSGFGLLAATGAPGRALLPRVREELERGG